MAVINNDWDIFPGEQEGYDHMGADIAEATSHDDFLRASANIAAFILGIVYLELA